MINYNKKHFDFHTRYETKQKQDQFYCRRKQNKDSKRHKTNKIEGSYSLVPKAINQLTSN